MPVLDGVGGLAQQLPKPRYSALSYNYLVVATTSQTDGSVPPGTVERVCGEETCRRGGRKNCGACSGNAQRKAAEAGTPAARWDRIVGLQPFHGSPDLPLSRGRPDRKRVV